MREDRERRQSPQPLTASSQAGVALVITLLAVATLSTLGLGLLLSSTTERQAASNHGEANAVLNAAESALELVARDLGAIADWDALLDGRSTTGTTDGSPGVRVLPSGAAIDLVALTNELSCGQPGGCAMAQVQAATIDRPWGRNNPRWRLFLHAPLVTPGPPHHDLQLYAIAWVGDDGAEVDGDVMVDGGGAGEEGRYIVRVRVEAFGARGSRRAVEAELARRCTLVNGVEQCLPGVRVRSWRVAIA